MKKQAGFSLVEVLLALAVGGLVLMAASSLLVTISQSWANRPATRDAFDAHVNGIAHFLTAVLEEATLAKEGSGGADMVELLRPVGFSETKDPLIKFYLREAPPLF
ncbi:MAG: prepilin-type N-terminal cleavage/methylation domain-containing protein, partial [Opitutae bacterium]|nr:prepilin-type N-terminal cleavage/methylation domain-containing protein [Opitutae bacterium]